MSFEKISKLLKALRNANPEAFDALWIYVSEINSTLDPFESKEVH